MATCKESYNVVFPTGFFEGKELSTHQCKCELFRQLIAGDVFNQYPIGTSQIQLYVQAAKTCPISGERFYPKPTFKVPTRGHHFRFKYVSRTRPSDPDLSNLGDGDINIS